MVRKHYHNSRKAGSVFCESSYEMRAALMLDEDPDVVFYETHLGFINAQGKKRYTDFIITYKDGSKKLVEIKPRKRVEEFTEQIEDNKLFANNNGWQFQVWTEPELGFNSEDEITRWADVYLSEIDKRDYVAMRKQRNSLRTKRHYRKKIAQDTVDVFCDYCQKSHSVLRLNYEPNIARNGRYICEREGGHIAGSKPKPTLRKENQYAAEGKKQCNKCGVPKLFEEFSPDKSKRDGYSTRCKTCRAEIYRLKYQNGNNDREDSIPL